MVAAWMSADTGVGPAIASGSQVTSGICALLPVQPRNNSNVESVSIAATPPVARVVALAGSRNQAEIAS